MLEVVRKPEVIASGHARPSALYQGAQACDASLGSKIYTLTQVTAVICVGIVKRPCRVTAARRMG